MRPQTQYFPWIPNVEVKILVQISILHIKIQHNSYLLINECYPLQDAFNILAVRGGTSFTSCTRCGSALSPLCNSGEEVVPLVESEKERFPWSFSKEGFVAPLSVHMRTTWAWDPSFWDLLSTSPTIYSTILILPRPIKAGSYPMVEREKSYVVALTFWPKSIGWA